jgi:cob(I)alamin adenosyltransferase
VNENVYTPDLGGVKKFYREFLFMGISTGIGDRATTRLQAKMYGGIEVPKDHPRVVAYGTIDELNTFIGLAAVHGFTDRLQRIQNLLFKVGAELSGGDPCITKSDRESLEREINEMEARLPQQKSFLIPGGGMLGASLFVACSVARRAEREVVSLHRQEPVQAELMVFLNRLSDWLFLCARTANVDGAKL